jgi:VanZ family protein
VPQHGRSGGAAGGPLSDGRPGRTRALPLIVAIVASSALVLSAPAIGSARSALRAAFPGAFARLIEGALALIVLGVIGLAVARIRTARPVRYGALVAALVLAWIYTSATGSPDPAIRAVEHVHFVEFGLITWLFLRAWRDRPDASALIAPALAAFVVGVGDEAFQWFLPARVGELADVWLNAVVIGCGLLAGSALTPPAALTGRWEPASVRLVTRLLALAVLAVTAFVHLVHLGHAIDVPLVGRFDSRYTADELRELSRVRAAVWRQAPPPVRPPRFSREDQYLTEGLQHVQARNRAWSAGEPRTAWRENLILERYFEPVLDIGHRWPAAQRDDAERRERSESGTPAFDSDAFPYPLYRVYPSELWALAVAAAGCVWLIGAWRARPARPIPGV